MVLDQGPGAILSIERNPVFASITHGMISLNDLTVRVTGALQLYNGQSLMSPRFSALWAGVTLGIGKGFCAMMKGTGYIHTHA